jgi:DNA-binding CsgD family transcriptional regulator
MAKAKEGQTANTPAPAASHSAHDIILAHPVFNLMQWLANSPSGDEVARELTLNYFQLLGAIQCRLALTDAEGNLYFVGSFGFEKHLTGTSQALDYWQSRTDEIVKIEIAPNGLGWSPSGQYLQARVNDFGDNRGWITIGFKNEFTNGFSEGLGQTDAEQLMQIIKHVIGIYMMTQVQKSSSALAGSQLTAGRDSFSPRQLSILHGMVEGKTNHELAAELGFSVSTIRHETMRIYELLGVSDRREAAREALDRKIV